jgi:hypothetical protein
LRTQRQISLLQFRKKKVKIQDATLFIFPIYFPFPYLFSRRTHRAGHIKWISRIDVIYAYTTTRGRFDCERRLSVSVRGESENQRRDQSANKSASGFRCG